MPPLGGGGARPRRVAIAVRTWAAEESIAVWNWASKYFIQARPPPRRTASALPRPAVRALKRSACRRGASETGCTSCT